MIREDGYINATYLCKSGGKEYSGWHRNGNSKKLIEKIYEKTKIDINILIQKSDISGVNNENRSTWVHPTIGLHIAQWISTEFFLQTVEWINEWKSMNENNEKYKKAIENIKPDEEKEQVEKIIQLYYKNKIGGEIEVETPFGNIDLLTDTQIIEIKIASQWKHALGQILSYSEFYPLHEKWIYLFDMNHLSFDQIQIFLKKFNVKLFIVNYDIIKKD
jgi:hypothetical protein